MTNSFTYQNQLTQDRFGLQIAARLSDAADGLSYEVTERLRAARVRALGKRKVAVVRTASSVVNSGGAATLTFGSDDVNWWNRLAALVPLLALVLGLIVINTIQSDNRANELAEIDAALLLDDLPPTAYTDAGFTQFLKASSEQSQ